MSDKKRIEKTKAQLEAELLYSQQRYEELETKTANVVNALEKLQLDYNYQQQITDEARQHATKLANSRALTQTKYECIVEDWQEMYRTINARRSALITELRFLDILLRNAGIEPKLECLFQFPELESNGPTFKNSNKSKQED